jgi:HSP20 family protein
MADTVPIRKPSSILDQTQEMQDRIMRRAYEIFEQTGGLPGRELEHWAQAERELVWKPPIEIREVDGQLQLEAAIAGVDPNDIDLEVTPEDIVLRAEIHHEHSEQKGLVHFCEFEMGSVFRAIHLPKKINPDKIKAEFKNGLLRLSAEIAKDARTKKAKNEAA